MKNVKITAELTTAEAMAYAQFLKRVGFNDYSHNAASYAETQLMLAAGEKIRNALAEKGYAPR